MLGKYLIGGVLVKRLKDVDNEFLNWFLDLLQLDLGNKIKSMKEKGFVFNAEYSTQLNKRCVLDLEKKKICKDNLFNSEGFLKIRYNHRSDSRIYFKDMKKYLTMVLMNENMILFVKYNYQNEDVVYFSLNNRIDIKNAETLVSDMIFVFKFLSEKNIIIN